MGNRSLIVGGVHGSEWITSLAALKFFEEVCSSAQSHRELYGIDFRELLAVRGLSVIPCLNPDGVQIATMGESGAGAYTETVKALCGGLTSEWKANARGVDLNHNFNAGWSELRRAEEEAGICAPSPSRFGGTAPESEPETAAIANFCRRIRPRQALALHSQGEEIFWKYGEAVPEGSERMAKVFAAVSGYSLVENEGLYAHGGFKDWFIKELRHPAFTIEIGRGKNPLPLSEFSEIYRPAAEIMAMFSIM